jgi:hypothetical protein
MPKTSEAEVAKPVPFSGSALRYCGPAIRPGDGVGLPQGWPAGDHVEPDDELRAEKIASGNYALVTDPAHDMRAARGLES